MVYIPAPIKIYKKKQPEESNSYVLDYNDPLGINSAVDVIFNEAALNKNYADPNDKLGQFDLTDVTQRVSAAVDLVYRSTIKPIQKQGVSGFSTALLNGLQNFGETMSVAANPVKGFLWNQDTHSIFKPYEERQRDFMRALGTTTEGRYNYDYDIKTGLWGGIDFAANMAAEVVSDPLTWAALGTAAAAKLASNSVEAGIKPVVQAGIEASANEVSAQLAKESAEVLSANTSDILTGAISKGLRSQQFIKSRDVSAVVTDAFRVAKLPIQDDVVRATTTHMQAILTDKLTNAISEDASLQVLKAVQKLGSVNNAVQKGLTKAVGITTGFGPAIALVKTPGEAILSRVMNKARIALNSVRAIDGTIPLNRVDEAARVYSDATKYAAHLNDVPADIDTAIRQTEFMLKDQADFENMHNIIDKYKKSMPSLQVALDQHIATKTDNAFNFETYTAYAQEFAQTHPDYQWYADELAAMQDTLHVYKTQGLLVNKNRASETADLMRTLADSFNAVDKRTTQLVESGALHKSSTGVPLAARSIDELKVYQLQISKAKSAYMLAKDSNLNKLFFETIQGKGIISALRGIQTASSEKYLYQALIDRMEVTSQAFFTMRQLLNRVHADDQLKPLLPRIYDILQSYGGHDLDYMLSNRYRNIEKIIQDVDTQQLLKSQKKLFNLEQLLTPEQDTKFIKFIEPYTKTGELFSHDAEYDALKTYFLLSKDGPLSSYNFLLKDTNMTPVIMDIETMALKSYGGQILQIGYVLDGVPHSVRIRAPLDVYPTEEVLYKLTHIKDRELAKRAFREMYTSESLPSEAEAISSVIDILQNTEQTSGKKIMLIGHNLETFDYQYLRQRMNTLVMDSKQRGYFSRIARIDTLDLLHEINNVPRMNLLQRSRLRSALSIYFTQRMNETLSNPNVQRTFINDVDKKFLSTLNKAKLLAKKSGRGADIIQSLDDQMQGVYKVLGNIRAINSDLSKSSIYWDFNRQAVLDKTLTPVPIGDALHVMQLIGDDSSNAYSLGLKSLYNAKDVQRFLTLPKGRGLTPGFLEEVNNFVHILDGYSRSLKRVELLEPHTGTMEELFDFLHNITNPNSFEYKYLQDIPVGLADKYAAIKALFDINLKEAISKGTVKDFNESVARWGANVDPELMTYIIDPEELTEFNSVSFEQVDEDLVSFFSPYESELMQKQKNSDARTIQIVNTAADEDTLHQLGSMHTEEKIDSALIQAEISILKPTLDNIKDYDGFLEELKDRNQPNLLRDYKAATIDYGDGMALANLRAITKVSPEYLQKHMWENSLGVITFSIPQMADDAMKLHTQDTINYFLGHEAEYAASDIIMFYEHTNRRLWLGLQYTPEKLQHWTEVEQAAKSLLEADYKGPVFSDLFVSQSAARMPASVVPFLKGFKIIEEEEQLLNNLVHNTAAGSLGDTIDLRNMTNIYDAMPGAFKEKIPSIQNLIDSKRFTTLHFNHTNLGVISSRKELEPYVSRNVWKNYVAAVQLVAHRVDTKLKNKYMFFDPVKRLDGEAFGALSDRDVLDIFKAAPAYKAAALIDVSDKKITRALVSSADNIIMQAYPMNTEAEVRIARAAGAIIMPPQTYLEASRAINDFHVTPWAVKLLNKYIVGPTKVGYLTSIGWPFRNTMDSTIKNLVLTGNLEDSPAMMKHIWATAKDVFEVNKIIKLMIEHPENSFKQPSMRIADMVFAENPDLKLSREMFQMYYDAMQQGATAGMSKTESDAIAEAFNKVADKTVIDKFMDKVVYHNPYTNLVMDTNSLLEQIMRLSGYTWSLTHGSTVDEAMFAVWKHHFDYTTKSIPMLYAEVVIPFLSFAATNMNFWLRAIEEHPWLATVYRDLATPAWNFDGVSNKELNENQSLQYQVLSGNIVLPDNLVIKVNPSIADAIQLATNPTAWTDRIIPVIRLPAQYFYQLATTGSSDIFTNPGKVVAQNLPMIGPFMQRYWQSDNTWEQGSALKGSTRVTDWAKIFPLTTPSIFGGVQRNYYFGYAGSGMVYMTHSEAKFTAQLANGAVEITVPNQIISGPSAYSRRLQKAYIRKRYYKKYYTPKKQHYTRKTYVKKVYAKKVYAKKSYVPTNYSYTVQTRILASMRRSQMRMPGSYRNISHIAPSIYRRIYSATGRDIFKTRMIPMTQAYLISRLRQDWAYLRR